MEKYKNIADKILGTAKELGADVAYCTVNENETHEFNVDGGEFSLFRTVFNRSIGIVTFIDGKKGTVAINSFDDGEIEKAVSDCIEASKIAQPDENWEIAKDIGEKHFHRGDMKPDTSKLFARTQELLEDIKERHPKILMEQMIVSHVAGRGVYMSTTGNTYFTETGHYTAELMYSGHEGEKATSFFGSDVRVADLEKPFIECALIERELTDIENQLDAKPTEGKFVGTVLFTPSCAISTVIGSVVSNFASDSVILDGTSIWKDKLGQRVADERITVSFKPHDERIVSGQRITGEGYLAQDYDLIKDGVLQSFMISQYVANKTDNKRAPNTSFSVVIEGGDTPLEEIIKGIERGVFIGRFSGGEPSTNGEFSGVAKNGFLIENGKIVSALSETMISGNLAEMLGNLRAISRETLVDGTVVAPYMAFDGVTVSGK